MRKSLFVALTLLMAVGMQATQVKFSATQWAQAQGLNNDDVVTSYTQDGVTVTFAQGTSTYAVVWNTLQSAIVTRAGNTMSVSVAEGYEFTAASFTMKQTSHAQNLFSSTWNVTTGKGYTANTKVVTWQGNTQTIEVTIGNTALFDTLCFEVSEVEPQYVEDVAHYNDTTVMTIREFMDAYFMGSGDCFSDQSYTKENKSIRFYSGKGVICFDWFASYSSYVVRLYDYVDHHAEITAPYRICKVILHDVWEENNVVWHGDQTQVDIPITDGSRNIKQVTIICDSTDRTPYTVRFYDLQDALIKTEPVLPGGSATAPVIEHECFAGWNKSFSNVHTDLDVYAAYTVGSSILATTWESEAYDNTTFTQDGYTITTLYSGGRTTPIWYHGCICFTPGDGFRVSRNEVFKQLIITCRDEENAQRLAASPCSTGEISRNGSIVYWRGSATSVTFTRPSDSNDNFDISSFGFPCEYYELVPHIVIFTDANGMEIAHDTVMAGEGVTPPAAPEAPNECLQFTGWDTELTKITSDVTVHPVYEQVIALSLTAEQWNTATGMQPITQNNFTLSTRGTYKDKKLTLKNDGKNNTIIIKNPGWFYNLTITCDGERTAGFLACSEGSFTRNGAVIKWTGSTDSLCLYNNSTRYDVNIVSLESECQHVSFTVVFLGEDGQVLSTQDVAPGADAVAPADPVHSNECMQFMGWDKEFTNVHSDLTIRSTWQLEEDCVPAGHVKVVFTDIYNEVIDMQFVLIGGDATAPQTPVLSCHTFIGWDHELTNLTENTVIKPLYTFDINSPDIMTVTEWATLLQQSDVEREKWEEGEEEGLRPGEAYAVKGVFYETTALGLESDGRYSFILTEDGQDHGETRVIAIRMLDPNKNPFYSTMQLNQGDTAIIYGTFGQKGITIPYQGGEWYTGIIEGYVPYIGKVNGDGNAVYIDLPRAEALYDFSGNGLKQAPIVEHKTTQGYDANWHQQYTNTITVQLSADATEHFRPKELYGKFTHVGEELGDANVAYVEDVNHDGMADLSSRGAGIFVKTTDGCERWDGMAVTNMDINLDGHIDYLILDQNINLSSNETAEYGKIAYQLADGSFQEQRMQVFTWDEFVAQMTPEELDQYQNPQNYSLGEVSRYTYPTTLGAVCLARAPKRHALNSKKAQGIGTTIEAPTKVIDLNKDGLMDLVDEKSGIIYTNMDNGKWVWTATNGAVIPAELNNDGVMDFVFPGEKLYTVIYNKVTKSFQRTLLYQNAASDRIVYCYDFDKDGDADILATFSAENNTTGYAYTCFFKNNGQGNFTQQAEQNYGTNKLAFMAMQDVDGDGNYDLLAYKQANNSKYDLVYVKGQNGLRFNTTPQVLAANAITRQTYWDSSRQPFSDYPVNAEDLDGDGKMEIWVSGTYYGSTAIYRIENAVANNAPTAPAQPTLNYTNGQLTITWGNGSDDKTATGDLTYALRIGTTPGGNEILAAHANADGTRRNFLDGNMGKEHSYTIDLTSYSPATIYVAVQAIDAQHAGSVWSEEATTIHDLVPVDFTLDKTAIAINETAVLTYTALPEGYTHQWTIEDGSYTQSTESAGKLILSFTSGGTKTITHTVTTPNGGSLTASATIQVMPAGLGEPIEFTYEDTRRGTLSASRADFNYDGRLDGVKLTDYSSGTYYSMTVQKGVASDDIMVDEPGLWNTNILTGGLYTSHDRYYWYDWNKDGHVDLLFEERYGNYKQYAYLPHDGNNSLSTRVDDAELENFFNEKWQDNPYDEVKYLLTDLDNNGYIDSLMRVVNPLAGETSYGDAIYGLYAWYKDATGIFAEGFLVPDAGSDLADCYLTPDDHYLLVGNSLYPIVAQADARPEAPTNIQASMTDDGLLITWDAAVDDHTPAANMRYNLSVKMQGAATYLISPQNGGNENAAFLPGYDYIEGTSYLIPTSELMNGNYEIAMQALDRQNKLSVFSQTITATVTRNPIEVPSFACADAEVVVSYRGAEMTGTPVWDFDGGIAEGYGFGPYTVTWTTGGAKTVTLTLNGQTYSATITIDDPKTLQVTIPTTLYEETPATATVPEGIEYQWFASIDGSELYPIDQYGVVLPTTTVFANYDYRLNVQGLNVTAHYKSNYTDKTLVGHQVVLCLRVTNANGCESYFSSNVTVMASTNIPTLTLITTDANAHNVINWTNADAFTTVNVYKEGNSLNDFQLIGSAVASTGTYTDNTSDASQKAERYRLTGVTANGNESPESAIHKTVHLTINRGVMDGTYNLIWNEYAGANIVSYNILRGATPTSLTSIATVAASNTSFTDQTPDDNLPYYAIEYILSAAANAPARDTNRAPAANLSGRSNVVDRRSAEQGLEEISSSLQGGDRGRLILVNGQIFILRGEKVYTPTGQEVK